MTRLIAAVCALLAVHGADASEPLVVPAGSFDLVHRSEGADGQLFIVRSDDWNALRPAIETAGGKILGTLPHATAIARMTPEALELCRAATVAPYEGRFKIRPGIELAPVVTVEARLFPDARFPAEAIAALGRIVEVREPYVTVELPRSRLEALAALESIAVVQARRPRTLHGQESSSVIQIGAAASARSLRRPYNDAGILGTGQLLALVDNGISLDAADLADTRSSAGSAGAGHRKVQFYGTTDAFGGAGDDEGCDLSLNGGRTHGHGVAAIALGNATRVDEASYGTPVRIEDPENPGNFVAADGVAPGARLIAYDAQVTPPVGACPTTIDPGDLHPAGALADAHARGARSFTLAYGASGNGYGADALDVDTFLEQHADAMLVVSAGNDGRDDDEDLVPDLATLADPGTAKNAISVGATLGLGDPTRSLVLDGSLGQRLPSSSTGPAPGGRVAPLLMAAGSDGGARGPLAAYACGSSDNDGSDPVECLLTQGWNGTSTAAASVSGALLLLHDYFGQGFYPDGTTLDADNASDITAISGAAAKATLVASAELVGIDFRGLRDDDRSGDEAFDNLTLAYRFNDEQGYGRVQLDRVLPLAGHPSAPGGLVVHDGAGAGPRDIPGLLDVLAPGASTSGSFEICDPKQQLRVALVWIDPVDGQATPEFLVNDLDLELRAPGATDPSFIGNFFTDDIDRSSGNPDPQEDCGTTGARDEGAWSIPIASCPPTLLGETGAFDPYDDANPSEAIFLEAGQAVAGTYQVTVRHNGLAASPAATNQSFALVVSGGVCLESSVRFERDAYACNETASFVVAERFDASDPLEPIELTDIEARTTIEVLRDDVCSNDCSVACEVDGDCGGGTCEPTRVCDTESGPDLTLQQPDAGLRRFVGTALLSPNTAADPGSGALDIRPGDRLRVLYDDDGVVHSSTAALDCKLPIDAETTFFAQWGEDTHYDIVGGCERSARGLFENEAPDLYMDAGELLAYDAAFQLDAASDGIDIEAALRCVLVGPGDAPVDCPPGSTGCHPDPERLLNTPCPSWFEIVEPEMRIARVAAGQATTVGFRIRIDPSLDAEPNPSPTIELVLELTSPNFGLIEPARSVRRHRLNVDESSTFYSTDFPTGGAQIFDVNNNDHVESPTTALGGGRLDAVIENRVFGDLTAGGTKNLEINAPWDFDRNDGGFRSGLNATSTVDSIVDIIANWGEDMDFNGFMTGRCESDPSIDCNRFPIDGINCGGLATANCDDFEDREPAQVNALLDQNWSADGGCGWQTDNTTASCQGGSPTVVGRPCFDNGDCVDAGNPVLQGTCTGPKPPAGGIWHTGRIAEAAAGNCLFGIGATTGDCQRHEVVSGETGQNAWWELLLTPVVHKVNTAVDPLGDPAARVAITHWAWNQAIDLTDNNVLITWELDTNTATSAPVDLIADADVLNSLQGSFGAVSDTGTNSLGPEQTRGYGVFAPLRSPAASEEESGYNGVRGSNRHGRNSCIFEENAFTSPLTFPFAELGIAGPADDDVLNGYCDDGSGDTSRSCSLVCDDETSVRCSQASDCTGTCGTDGFCTNALTTTCTNSGDCVFGTCVDADPVCDGDPCTVGSGSVDQYVTANGPLRNFDITDVGGPDMRFNTLEDLYGPSGESFQGALGMLNVEGVTGNPATSSYGLAIDDMVLEWREIALAADTASCSGGECATLRLGSTVYYEGSGPVAVTLYDPSPYQRHCATTGTCELDGLPCSGPGSCDADGGPCISDVCFGHGDCANADCTATTNDCDCNGWRLDAGDTNDCDMDGTPDLTIRAASNSEPEGECVTLNLTSTPGLYGGEIPVSLSSMLPGTLFLAPQGTQPPEISVSYDDLDDGSGSRICQNALDPSLRGTVRDSAPFILGSGTVVVSGYTLFDNGDDDGFADDNETVTLFVEVTNASGRALDNVTLRLATNDVDVDCILDGFSAIERLEAGAVALAGDPFVLRIGNVGRTDPLAERIARLTVTVSSDQLRATTGPQAVHLPLDLDFSGGGAPTTFFESFESAVPGSSFDGSAFELNDMDAIGNTSIFDPPNLVKSDGFRCTFHDPDWLNGADPGRSSCYLNDWNTDPIGPWSTPTWRVIELGQDNGRAYSGSRAASYSLDIPGIPNSTTTPFSSLEAIEMRDPINLSADAVTPTLRFRHQVSLADSRMINITPGEAADRAVAHLQVADAAGEPAGDWIKLQPVQNLYDQQGTDNYFNCMFDPIDDGNTEDSFFDPTDPLRNNGPSSTCYPEFTWVNLGSTAGRYSPAQLGNAEGPGLEGSGVDPVGTWVESVVPLSSWRGRRIRLRFLASSLELGAAGVQTYEQAFAPFNPDPGEDGWFIDDVEVTGALDAPGTISADVKDNTALPDCGPTCTSVNAQLAAEPAASPAGGHRVELDASASSADRCLDGGLHYRFLAGGALLRDWSEDPIVRDAPGSTTAYTVEVRCATDPACAGSVERVVPVGCPSSGTLGGIFATITAPSATTLDLGGNEPYSFAVGALASLSSYTVASSGSGSGSSFDISALAADSWILFKSVGTGLSCNEVATWRSGGAGEVPGRDIALP